MTELHAIAHAKLNLTLDVLGKRPDGYHDLEMVMQEIALGDEITLTLDTGAPWSVVGDAAVMPCDDSNLAIKAAKLFFAASGLTCDGLRVEIRKHTPVCAGMGGGSADGAAVLRMLWEHYGRPIPEESLYRLAEQTGSDVPFALFGGTALAREKGQVLSRLPSLPHCYFLLCKPVFPISTPELFRAIDQETISERPDNRAMTTALESGDLQACAALLFNVFQCVVSREHSELQEIQNTMRAGGALGTCMTGSGPTMFGIFDQREAAERTKQQLPWKDVFLTEPV